MIDLQTAADGVGRLRARHKGGTEGVLMSIEFNRNQPMWHGHLGAAPMPLEKNCHILVVALDDGGRLEAPQRSFEVAEPF